LQRLRDIWHEVETRLGLYLVNTDQEKFGRGRTHFVAVGNDEREYADGVCPGTHHNTIEGVRNFYARWQYGVFHGEDGTDENGHFSQRFGPWPLRGEGTRLARFYPFPQSSIQRWALRTNIRQQKRLVLGVGSEPRADGVIGSHVPAIITAVKKVVRAHAGFRSRIDFEGGTGKTGMNRRPTHAKSYPSGIAARFIVANPVSDVM
jgi:hypothetical protein